MPKASDHDKGEKSPLDEYRRKRDFSRTPEPSGSAPAEGDVFVVQKHAASHLHYDFRLRLHGALKSWAVPKGPSLHPGQHRLADQTEDHPLEYADFEGVIPAGNYGAGTVLIWDTGTWEPLDGGKRDYYSGRLRFVLHGTRLRGTWLLIRQEGKKWLLIKEEDEFATTEEVLAQETSVVSGRTLEEIAADRDRLWTSDRGLIEEKPVGFGHPLGESFPDFISPQVATLVNQVPEGDGWLHEIKYDGFRMVCRIDKEGRGIRFFTRKGYDFTERLHLLARAAARLPVTRAWLDGEIVVFTKEGKSDFHALQNAFRNGNDRGIVYLVFDLMNYEGYDLRPVPLEERKALLADLVPPMDEIRYVDHVVGNGAGFFEAACERKLEGILSKRLDAEYVSERSRRWLKVKCAQRQEFIVGGYTESGVGRPFGSLLAGYYNKGGELVFAGKIKTGYSASLSESLIAVLRRYEQPAPPFVNPPSGVEYRTPHWLRPELIAEAAFTEISGTGLLRHASFKGLREDKDPREVVLETPEPIPEEPEPEESMLPPAPAILPEVPPAPGSEPHPAQVLPPAAEPPAKEPATPRSVFGPRKPKEAPVYPHERIMREEIVAHYALVADRMLPYTKDRPLTLISCRTNIYACKFTKHATNFPAPVKAIEAGHEEKYIAVDSKEGLLTLARMGVVEVHAWQSRSTDLEHPDRLLFDLDPPEAEGFPWERIAEAALRLRIHLKGYGLESFLQTTGGKGYYVVVPLAPVAPWKEVTGFARRISEEMEREFPAQLTAKLAKEERGDRIYIDWMRNGRGANAAEPFTLRARPGAPVAVPITWEELVAGVRPGAFHLRDLEERLRRLERDPWEGYFRLSQTVPPVTRS